MNGKKARQLRQILREQGGYKTEPDYRVKKVSKIAYFPNPITGVPIAQKVTKQIIYNLSRYAYRRAKKDYKKGLISF